MRIAPALLAAALGTTLLAAMRPTARPAADVTVDVSADCVSKDSTTITVSPWTVSVSQGDSIAWAIDPESRIESIDIAPKKAERWPFTDRPPYKGGKGRPARGRNMKPDAKGTYSYDVTVTCKVGNKQWKTTLDPDIVVD
jgi:hypothetical protein